MRMDLNFRTMLAHGVKAVLGLVLLLVPGWLLLGYVGLSVADVSDPLALLCLAFYAIYALIIILRLNMRGAYSRLEVR